MSKTKRVGVALMVPKVPMVPVKWEAASAPTDGVVATAGFYVSVWY